MSAKAFYRIIVSTNLKELEAEINKFADEGYRLCGGVEFLTAPGYGGHLLAVVFLLHGELVR